MCFKSFGASLECLNIFNFGFILFSFFFRVNILLIQVNFFLALNILQIQRELISLWTCHTTEAVIRGDF